MYPVELYRTVQDDRHARLGRLARSVRRARQPARPAPSRPGGRPVTVRGPSGDVLLDRRGVTLLAGGRHRPARHAPVRR